MKSTKYAIIDADGHATNNKSPVYSTHVSLDNAKRKARTWNRDSKHQVQIIEGDLTKGEDVYLDAVGRVYARVEL